MTLSANAMSKAKQNIRPNIQDISISDRLLYTLKLGREDTMSYEKITEYGIGARRDYQLISILRQCVG